MRVIPAVLVFAAMLASAAAPATVLGAQTEPTLAPVTADGAVTYFVEEGTPASSFRPGDRQLAIWALESWARASNGALRFAPAAEREALIQVKWVAAEDGQYGEMRPLRVNGRRGAAVYIRPDTDGLGPVIGGLARKDALMRDTIVYLTCLHELGHALGLSHTAEYADIMYAFPFGGDIPRYFGRYRDQLSARGDIAKVSGLSTDDVARIRALYPAQTASAVLFEGARLIAGDGGAPIERAAFLVEGGRFTRVGRMGELSAPAGATRVNLAGKTVIPALVDAHSHIGYMRNLTSGPQNYTRENILDHMRRFAWFGVAASQAMGSDFGEMPFALRDEILAGKIPDAARFLSAGRGLAPLVEISAGNMRHAAFPVTTVEGARAAVQELVPRKVTIVKTWVDSRGGTITPLEPAIYRAIIDEAHKHQMRVAVHATGLADAKALLRAGIDIFAHMIADVDDELIALFKEHPGTVVLSALGGPRRLVSAPWIEPPHPLIAATVSPEQIARLQDRLRRTTAAEKASARDAWDRLAHGVARLQAAGVRIGVGTDGGGQTGDQFIGWTMHTEMENLVAAGLTPAQALVAATRTSAEILGLADLGTVAAGKSADFVVLDADPLADITNTRTISAVYLRGAAIDRAQLQRGFRGN